jgi:predicted alpha/beta hydrolase
MVPRLDVYVNFTNGAAMLDDAQRSQVPATGQVRARDIQIQAEDGSLLAASFFAPPHGASATAPLTVIAGGAGIARGYYGRLAAWLAERGRPALTFDYRDIGGSRSGSIKGSQVRMRDWCILDVPGVIAWTAREHPGRPLNWIGHSMGGFATGLAHNGNLIARQLNVGTLSGYWRNMAFPELYRVRLMMGTLGPLVVRACGYLPGPLLGGEDMPGPAFLEWRHWCMSPDFLFDDPTLPEAANVPRFRAPLRFGQVEDDPWGTPAAVESIASRFTGSVDRTIWRIRLSDAGVPRIGHHGFFRSECRNTLWPAAVRWLDG